MTFTCARDQIETSQPCAQQPRVAATASLALGGRTGKTCEKPWDLTNQIIRQIGIRDA